MAKKYLLYIHDELFEKEPKKSQLVNNLLERHYHDTVGGKTQDEIKESLGLRLPPVAKKPKVPDLEVVKELSRQQNNPRFSGAIASCRIHGLPLDSRGRCLQKGCKYS